MESFATSILYILVFFSVYVQVFLLVTFLENRKKITTRHGLTKLSSYPEVTIIVPCWNEEGTVAKTVNSLLDLNYPKDKLKLFLIDDGSTDNTFSVLKKFEKESNVEIYKKENGGKYTVLNFGLEKSTSEFIGCLDADSVVDRDALARIMSNFAENPAAMAVVPSVTVTGAKNILQNAQEAEYHMGVFLKKMLDFLGAINVTPGPFTIFRKKVFEDLGPYKHAHNTEDMEIAYRMQVNGYEITHCNDAFVYTTTPATVKKLYKQRLRWVYGFINNTIDYRRAIFNKKYGNFALFTLPVATISFITVGYLFIRILSSLFEFFQTKLLKIEVLGLSASGSLSWDPFYISTETSFFLTALVFIGVMFAIMFGRKMTTRKFAPNLSMLYYLIIFRFLAPVWIFKAMWRTIRSRTPEWR